MKIKFINYKFRYIDTLHYVTVSAKVNLIQKFRALKIFTSGLRFGKPGIIISIHFLQKPNLSKVMIIPSQFLIFLFKIEMVLNLYKCVLPLLRMHQLKLVKWFLRNIMKCTNHWVVTEWRLSVLTKWCISSCFRYKKQTSNLYFRGYLSARIIATQGLRSSQCMSIYRSFKISFSRSGLSAWWPLKDLYSFPSYSKWQNTMISSKLTLSDTCFSS